MRTDNNGIARFDWNNRLVHRCGCRIRGWDQCCHNSHRYADFHQPILPVIFDDTHSFHVLDTIPCNRRTKQIFQYLILPYTKSGFLHGHLRQTLRLSRTGISNCLCNPIHLLLWHLCQLFLSYNCLRNKPSHFLNRLEVLIKIHSVSPSFPKVS